MESDRYVQGACYPETRCYNLYSRSQTTRRYAVRVLGTKGKQRLRKVQAVILSSLTRCSTKSLKNMLTRL